MGVPQHRGDLHSCKVLWAMQICVVCPERVMHKGEVNYCGYTVLFKM